MSVARASRIESGAGDADGVGGSGRPEASVAGSTRAAAGAMSAAGRAGLGAAARSAIARKIKNQKLLATDQTVRQESKNRPCPFYGKQRS